jgi:hypothetical protein
MLTSALKGEVVNKSSYPVRLYIHFRETVQTERLAVCTDSMLLARP